MHLQLPMKKQHLYRHVCTAQHMRRMLSNEQLSRSLEICSIDLVSDLTSLVTSCNLADAGGCRLTVSALIRKFQVMTKMHSYSLDRTNA